MQLDNSSFPRSLLSMYKFLLRNFHNKILPADARNLPGISSHKDFLELNQEKCRRLSAFLPLRAGICGRHLVDIVKSIEAPIPQVPEKGGG